MLLAVVGIRQHGRAHAPADFIVAPVVTGPPATSSRADIAPPLQGVAHAPTAIALDDGRLAAFWFEGSREAAADVRIRRAIFADNRWEAQPDLIDARSASRALGRRVGTVGNPMAFRVPSGEYWLVFVSVGIGGWSGSALNLMKSPDGLTWSAPRRLVTSPFLNLSTLGKAPAVSRADGTVALPVYHELIAKFPELLTLDAQGRVIDKIRMGAGGRSGIQPWLVPLGPREAVAFLRQAVGGAGQLRRVVTLDAGNSWSRPMPVGLPNPRSPVAAAHLGARRIGLVFNDDPRQRTLLRLAVSDDGGAHFRRAGILEDGRANGVFHRYPWLMRDSLGRLHLLVSAYRDNGVRAILHRVFDASAFDLPEGAHVP